MPDPIYEEIRARDWWLVFERDAGRPEAFRAYRSPWWVRIWTDAEFRHVWAFGESRVGAGTIVVQSLGTMLIVDWHPMNADEAAEAVAAQGHRVVRVAGSVRQCYLPRVSQCVTDTKRLLGIRAWWIWTPRQLWRYVHRRGLVLCTHEPST